MQEVVAAEETLLASVFFDGRALGGIPVPRDYDPAKARRWLPATFQVIGEPNHPQIPAAYGLVDRASSLEGLAETLHAAVELAFVASALNPNPNLRDVFQGNPFGAPPPGGPGRPIKPATLAAPEVTWCLWKTCRRF